MQSERSIAAVMLAVAELRGEVAVAEAQQARARLEGRVQEALQGQAPLLLAWQERQVGAE